jgi:hypothetical protein
MADVSEALALVMRDLAATRAVLPEVDEIRWSGLADRDTVMLRGLDGSGQGVWALDGDEFAVQVASVADQVQEWTVEELSARGRPATWPECPVHPNAHPLSALVRDRRAVWVCPTSGVLVGEVGGLPARPAQGSGVITPSP